MDDQNGAALADADSIDTRATSLDVAEAAKVIDKLLDPSAGQARDDKGRFTAADGAAEGDGQADTASGGDAGEGAPGDDQASAEDDQGEGEPDTTAIAAPASWSAEDKVVFAKLPPEAQAIIARRESEREKGINQRLAEIAEKEKGIEPLRQAIEQERQQLARLLAENIPAEQRAFNERYKDVTDPAKLAAEDPARYTQMTAEFAAIRAKMVQSEQLRQQEAEKAAAELAEFRTTENAKIREALKLDTDEKWTAWEKATGDYLVAQGIPVELIRNASAKELEIAHKARLWDEAQAKAAKAREQQGAQPGPRQPPKVERPGAGSERGADAQRAAKAQRLRKTGRIEDAAAVIADMI